MNMDRRLISADDNGNESISNDEDEAPIITGHEAADNAHDVDKKGPIIGADADASDVTRLLSLASAMMMTRRLPSSAVTAMHMMWTRVPSSTQMMQVMWTRLPSLVSATVVMRPPQTTHMMHCG